MANKMVSQLLLVALAVPQVICTNTSQSDYASFDEHVQTDCFKGGELPGHFGKTGINLKANPASPCKTCSGSGPENCLTCYEGSTLWFTAGDCSGICASDPTGSTVGEGGLFGGLKGSNIAFTSRRRKPRGAYNFIGEGAPWKDKSCCQPSWGPDKVRDGDRTCCRHGMDQFELTCKPEGCKNVPSAYYYPAHSKDPYKDCGGKYDSEVEVRMYSRASGSKFKYEGVDIVDSVDACPEGKICNPYGIRRYSEGMPAALTRTSRRRRGNSKSKSKDDDSDDDDDDDDDDDKSKSKSKDDDDKSKSNSDSDDDKSKSKSKDDDDKSKSKSKDDDDKSKSKDDSSDSSDESKECKACKKECKKNGGSKCGKKDCKKFCRPDSLFEVAQDKDSSDGTGKNTGLMRRSGRKGKIATAIESEGEVGSSQS